jgi:acyl-CoA thioester hydrolase
MTDFNFYQPIEVRYGDLDPQGHVNNAKYLTYFEHARSHYLVHLGLFAENRSFLEIGIILARITLDFFAPVQWEDKIKVGVRTTGFGNKSMKVAQNIVNRESGQVYASGEVILVAYDYHQETSIPVPEDWRRTISEFEEFNE